MFELCGALPKTWLGVKWYWIMLPSFKLLTPFWVKWYAVFNGLAMEGCCCIKGGIAVLVSMVVVDIDGWLDVPGVVVIVVHRGDSRHGSCCFHSLLPCSLGLFGSCILAHWRAVLLFSVFPNRMLGCVTEPVSVYFLHLTAFKNIIIIIIYNNTLWLQLNTHNII